MKRTKLSLMVLRGVCSDPWLLGSLGIKGFWEHYHQSVILAITMGTLLGSGKMNITYFLGQIISKVPSSPKTLQWEPWAGATHFFLEFNWKAGLRDMPWGSWGQFCDLLLGLSEQAACLSFLIQKFQLSMTYASVAPGPLQLSLVFLHVEVSLRSQLVRGNSGSWLNTSNFHLNEACDRQGVFAIDLPPGYCRWEGMQRSGGLWALEKGMQLHVNYKRINTISQTLYVADLWGCTGTGTWEELMTLAS